MDGDAQESPRPTVGQGVEVGGVFGDVAQVDALAAGTRQQRPFTAWVCHARTSRSTSLPTVKRFRPPKGADVRGHLTQGTAPAVIDVRFAGVGASTPVAVAGTAAGIG